MHTMWKGSIRFGLVNIPIKLHTATEDKGIHFRTLHKKCHTPISYQKFCSTCEEVVENEDIEKGFETENGEFITVEESERKEIEQQFDASGVDILDFVKLDEIDPLYFKKSYYISPQDGGEKAYALLRSALEESKCIGIATFVLRAKQQLAALRIVDQCLVVETMHFYDEVRDVKDVPNVPERIDWSKKELSTALLLIDQLTKPFDPTVYKDEYREAMLKQISSKTTTKAKKKEPKKRATTSTDLLEALQASIDRTKPKEQKKAPARTRKKKESSS